MKINEFTENVQKATTMARIWGKGWIAGLKDREKVFWWSTNLGSLQENGVTDVSDSTQDHSQGHTCSHTAGHVPNSDVTRCLVNPWNTKSWKNFNFTPIFSLSPSLSLTWKDIGIVSLSRSEDATIAQSHWRKWTATGKETSTLWGAEHKEERQDV